MTNVALIDPKFIDGEPWEVADKAGEQVLDSIDLTLEALEGLRWSARGSWLSQEDYRTGTMPDGPAFDQTPLGTGIGTAHETLTTLRAKVKVLRLAAAFDPRSY